MATEQTTATPIKKDWKYRTGMGLFIYSLIPICTIELVAFMPITSTQAVAFGVVYLASGEIAMLLAVALLGKPFIQAIKEKVKGFLFKRREPSISRMIGRTRHWIGITLLLLSILPYYITIGELIFMDPGRPNPQHQLTMLLAGESLFIVSLFVLGDEFWARLKRLFEWPGNDQIAGGSIPYQ